MTNQIRIVLVNTSHPGNIGAAARAMKTMGLSQLYLVAPGIFPHDKAIEMASAAVDVLACARVVSTLEEAVTDCNLVVGTSVRPRTIPWPLLTPRECAAKVVAEPDASQVAIVFGREQSGLSNEELHRCHFHLQIPSNQEYGSLNLAAAVQVVCYELYVASLETRGATLLSDQQDYAFATAKEMEGFFLHLEQTLMQIGFLDPKAPRQLMTRLRRLFLRSRLDVMEVNILRGILGVFSKFGKSEG
jgi:tRNA (cytidine32/uridine32-2'-O)-methyltransferase